MSGDRLRILLVDDDAGDRKHLRRMLCRATPDCTVQEVDSVSKGVSVDHDGEYDCIFLDFQMPGMDGLTALGSFINRWPDAAVIMSTGQGDENIASEAIKAGAVDYIAKRDVTEVSIGKTIGSSVAFMEMRRKLREQQRDLETFAHVLVHDLAAPIVLIRSLVEFTEENIRDERFDLVREDVSNIGKSADRMGALIRSLSTHILMDGEIEPVRVAASSIVQGAVEDLHAAIECASAEVNFGDLPDIHGDPAQLTQLFQNLISNAIKFCAGRTPRIDIDARTGPDGKSVFSVSDNGIGIAEESRRQIFEPFSRLNGMNAYEGSGLGLATCRRIVQRHGGEIWCESEVGTGTTFLFTLPLPSVGSENPIAA